MQLQLFLCVLLCIQLLVCSFVPSVPLRTTSITNGQTAAAASRLYMAGFGKKEAAVSTEHVVDGSSQCLCGSGSVYSDCCGKYHAEGAPNPTTPEALVRARFSAFVYMKIGYLLRSTHPESKDYCLEEEVVGSKRTKRQIWKKQLEARAGELDFSELNFSGGGEEVSATGDTAKLTLTLKRKPKASTKWDVCAESITCKKAEDGGWMYLQGKTEVTEENNIKPKQVKITNKKR